MINEVCVVVLCGLCCRLVVVVTGYVFLLFLFIVTFGFFLSSSTFRYTLNFIDKSCCSCRFLFVSDFSVSLTCFAFSVL